MEQISYLIKQKEFKDLYKKIELMHSNIALIKLFCNQYENVDEFYIIMPIIKYTDKITDCLYAKFIDLKHKKQK